MYGVLSIHVNCYLTVVFKIFVYVGEGEHALYLFQDPSVVKECLPTFVHTYLVDVTDHWFQQVEKALSPKHASKS